jgi:plasmid stabilization system protein ParE
MARLIISLLAQSDTAYILSDLAGKAGYAVAAKYAADFESLYERLAVFPDSGHPRPPSGRMSVSASCRLTSMIHDHDQASNSVTILRIVHGKRKIKGKLLRGG